jgi:hypothetical protein
LDNGVGVSDYYLLKIVSASYGLCFVLPLKKVGFSSVGFLSAPWH